MKRHLAVWTVALLVPGGVFILIAYYLRTQKFLKEDS
jgi:hypothetical protein